MIETRTTIQPHKSPSFAHSRQLQRRAHARIPGGAHTYAKGDDQYPVNAPSFIARREGCHVWDVDGNEFIEYGMGLRSVMLGHAYGPVIEAAREQLSLGANFARPSPLEVECADKLAELVPSAGMVKFAKDGSTVTSAAVRLARAFTGRDRVVVCKDDPFISTADWFIGTTPMSAGIPQAVRALTLSFPYNDLPSLELLFAEHPGEIACVIMEAERGVPPIPGFLGAVSALCHREGTLFILDEMITGFRWALGGAQEVYGVAPDLSCFGKGMANGFSVSALVGRREIMELGGWQHAGPRVFLNSTTHGGETHSLAAAMKTMEIFQAEPVTAARRRRAAHRGHRRRDRTSRRRRALRPLGPGLQPRLHHPRRPGRALTGLSHALPAGDHQARPAHALARRELLARRGRHRVHDRGDRRGPARLPSRARGWHRTSP